MTNHFDVAFNFHYLITDCKEINMHKFSDFLCIILITIKHFIKEEGRFGPIH
jgi:hypothetical protein